LSAFLGLALVTGDEFEKTDGTVLRGEASSFNEFGLVVRLDVGGFSDRVPWGRLTEATLRKLVQNPKAKEFVEQFLEPEPSERPTAAVKEIPLKQVPRVGLPEPGGGLFAALMTPGGLMLLAAIYLANLYAAFSVAKYRSRSVAAVCGVSALLPWVGPLLFLSLPAEAGGGQEGAGAEAPGAPAEVLNPLAQPGAVPASGLSLAAVADKASGAMQPATYNRGDTTFNRRFFETKFPGFFRVVMGEAEKDLVLVVRAGRTEYVARRVSRISASDMHLQLLAGSNEVSVSFGEITQVQVRPKDAKA
jgi:hypothetical protein